MRTKLILSALALLSACYPSQELKPPATPHPVMVNIHPYLPTVEDDLRNCAKSYSQVSLIIIKTTKTTFSSNTIDIVIRLGYLSTNSTRFTFTLGREDLAIIVNPSNPFDSMEADQVRELYTRPGTSHTIWSYPNGNILRQIFDPVVLKNKSLIPQAYLAPNPDKMLEAIANDPRSIGYIPKTWLTSTVKAVELDENLQFNFKYPIVAYMDKPPNEVIHNLLLCMQKESK